MVTKSRIDPKPLHRTMADSPPVYYKSKWTLDKVRADFWAKFMAIGDTTSPGFFQSSSTITYDLGKQKFNACDHTQRRFTTYMYDQPIFRYFIRDVGYGWKCQGQAHSYGFYPSLPSVSPPAHQITDELRKEAWGELLPQLNDGFSLANFLWELRDIPSLLLDIARVLRALSSLRAIANGISTLTLAKAQLTWSFAISPLIGDLDSIINRVMDFRKRLNEFIDAGKKVQSYHHRKELYRYTGEQRHYIGTQLDEVYVLYAATLRASYVYKRPSDWEAFSRIAGLRITPEVIWNGIPFSFVVDWLLKVGDALRNLDRDPNLTIKIHDYCDSLKTVRSRKVICDASNWTWITDPTGIVEEGWIYGSEQGKTAYEVADVTYHRIPGKPDTGYSLPVLDTLSARELVLGGALLRTSISH